MKKLYFATDNKGKLEEVRGIFSGTNFEIRSMNDLGNIPEIEETGETFEENSFIKARYIFNRFGVPVIADDSGLSIEQLDGRPGVYSARYAGKNCTFEDNNRKVLDELSNMPDPHQAKFVSFAVYYDGKNEFKAVGELPGKIIHEFRGKHGFGYDPIFVPDGYNTTLAEMTLEEKNKISHRAKSFNKLKELLLKSEV